MAGDAGAPLEYVHSTCGNKTHAVVNCSECGDPLRPQEVTTVLGPALAQWATELDSAQADGIIPTLFNKRD
jgi:hypothetical protein